MRLGVIGGAAALAVVAGFGAAAVASTRDSSAQEEKTYIVQLAPDPVVAYGGGVSGLSATEPAQGRKIDPRSTEVRQYARHLEARHQAALDRAGGGKKLYDYVYAYNGFAAKLTKDQAAALKAQDGVLAVTEDKRVEKDTSFTPRFLGVDRGLWRWLGGADRRGGAGEDVIIGDIDTGIWPESLSFTDRKIKKDKLGKVTYGEVDVGAPPDGWAGTCAAGEELDPAKDCNRKLIGARHFNQGFGGDAGIEEGMPWEYTSARDYNGHGTHTASTAGGNHGVPTTGPTSVVGEEISGMAPRARIAAYKALWSSQDGVGAGGFYSDIVAAIDQAVADGVDVINFSVSGTADDFRDPVEVAFLFAADAGIFVSASAGNDGPELRSVEHPSPWLTTVAAGTHSRDGRGSVTLGNGRRYTGASLGEALGPAPLVDASAAGLPDAVPSQVAQCFSAADNLGTPVLDPAKVRGKIVVCDRGENSRLSKSFAVKQAGGVGMILVNTSPNSVNADFHFVPTVHIADTARAAVKAYAASAGATARLARASLLFDAPAPFAAAFSSRGPVAVRGDLVKPDVIAPGQDILAAAAPPGSQGMAFNMFSGTSMSAPHVAGIAALLKDLHPRWSPMAIKSAMMTTGTDLRDGPGTDPSVIFAQGAGHVRPNDAADPGLVYDSGRNDWLAFLCGSTDGVEPSTCDALEQEGHSLDPRDLNVPSIAIGRLPVATQTVTRRVTNVGRRTATYRASFAGLKGVSATVSPRTLTIRPGESRTFEVSFTRTSAPFDEYAGGQLRWSDGEHVVRSPIILRPGKETWSDQYATDRDEAGKDIALDPQGRRVYVTGPSYEPVPGVLRADVATVAYDAVTGRRIWAAEYAGPAGSDEPFAIGVSPDGRRVFVTALSDAEGRTGWATVAYDAATGRELWVKRHEPAAPGGFAEALAVSPDGATVFVTGMGHGPDAEIDSYTTIAYDAATGEERWAAHYDSHLDGADDPRAIGVSPDGKRVFITGQSAQMGTGLADWGTIAYDAATGEQLWTAFHNGPGNELDIANALTVSRDGATVFVAGNSSGMGTEHDWATIAYDAVTGKERWTKRYDGPAKTTDTPRAMTLVGDTLVVTGNSDGESTGVDWTTVAYDAGSGEQRWEARHDGPAHGFDIAWDLAPTPDGSRIAVVGEIATETTSNDYGTIVYDMRSGSEVWSERYDGIANGPDAASAVAVGAPGVFVTGRSSVTARGVIDFSTDMTTVAYPLNGPEG